MPRRQLPYLQSVKQVSVSYATREGRKRERDFEKLWRQVYKMRRKLNNQSTTGDYWQYVKAHRADPLYKVFAEPPLASFSSPSFSFLRQPLFGFLYPSPITFPRCLGLNSHPQKQSARLKGFQNVNFTG